MPSISYDGFAAWSNYHLTLGHAGWASPIPSVTVESLGRFHGSDTGAMPALERFAATARPLMDHLARLRGTAEPGESHEPRDLAAGITGRGWSFTSLIGAASSQLLCDGLAGTGPLEDGDRDPACGVPAARIALTGGGTRLRELVAWSEGFGLTIETSGTHLGATVAGSAATASHGSRLGYGGIQDMVLGLHLVVSDDEHVWIERASCPILSESGLARLEVPGANLRVIRDDDLFEDALVHLGCMGIVNGLAVELVPNDLFALMRRRETIDAGWLAQLAEGDYAGVAARLGCAATPLFYELTLNPHAPFADDAAHVLYFRRSVVPLLPPGPSGIVRPADAIGQLGERLLGRYTAAPLRETEAGKLDDPDPPTAVVRVLRQLLDHDSAFAFYRALGGFEPNSGAFDPDDPARPGFYWSGLHSDEITGNIPGALYNASFAVPLDRVGDAVPAICAAVAALEPSFVFTLRFVAKPAGTLAFTRFDHNAVIEIDGLSPLICKLAVARIRPDAPDADELLAALSSLELTLEAGALAVRAALEQATIPHSMHWAKLGELDKAKVYADYGHPGEAESLIRRWREARDRLLPPLGRALFWNEHARALGLLDPPTPVCPEG